MKEIKELIVVEGRDDIIRVQQVVKADCIETHGSAIDEAVFSLIEKAIEQRGVIVFTDPDFSGEKIRTTITQRFPQVRHAFLSKKEAAPTHKGSLGVEHASDEAILAALEGVSTPCRKEKASIPRSFLQTFGLLAGSDAKKRRAYLGEALHIGYTNGKQLQKRLAMFGITTEQIEAVMIQYEKIEN